MRISDWSADVCSSDLLQQQAISCLTGRQTRLAHMVSDLIRVGPEAAIAGSGRIDDVDVPAADKGVSLGVQDLEHDDVRSEEHTSELQSLMRISYAVFCLKKKITTQQKKSKNQNLLH